MVRERRAKVAVDLEIDGKKRIEALSVRFADAALERIHFGAGKAGKCVKDWAKNQQQRKTKLYCNPQNWR